MPTSQRGWWVSISVSGLSSVGTLPTHSHAHPGAAKLCRRETRPSSQPGRWRQGPLNGPSLPSLYPTHGLLRLPQYHTWGRWGRLSEELPHLGHGLCECPQRPPSNKPTAARRSWAPVEKPTRWPPGTLARRLLVLYPCGPAAGPGGPLSCVCSPRLHSTAPSVCRAVCVPTGWWPMATAAASLCPTALVCTTRPATSRARSSGWAATPGTGRGSDPIWGRVPCSGRYSPAGKSCPHPGRQLAR